jgi:peptidoglycan biosynthesis protein MviN/MurJ (putative lipid II flippase)
LIKLSLILGALAVCNAFLAILMPWYVVTQLGVGIQTDAFFASGALPQLIFLVASFSLTQVLVPLLATEDEKTFQRDAWGFFLAVTGAVTLLGVVLFALANYWVPLLVPGFSDEAKQLTVSLSRIQLLAMVGNASVTVLWSVYYARQKFIWAEVSPVFANLATLLFLFVTLPHYGIVAAAWTNVLNLALKLGFLIPVLGRWQWPEWDSYAMREAWRRIKPFLVGQTYSKSEPIIDRFLSSMSIAGDLSLLYIGQQVYSAINLIITKAIAGPTIPRLALAVKTGAWINFRHIYRQRILWMMGLGVAGGVGLLLFGESLLHLMIGHGGITALNVRMLWWIMLALTGLLIGGTAGQMTSAAFYAMGDTKTPTMLFIWTFTIYIPLKALIFLRYGVLGLAIATSAHLILNFMLQFVILERVTARKARPDSGATIPILERSV